MLILSMHYQHEKWVSRTWTTPDRYYLVEVNQAIFCECQCDRPWGSRRGNSKIIPAPTYQAALVVLDATAKRLQSRGYVLTA